MESKRVMMLVTIMIVMGNLLIQTEAQSPSPFISCYPGCIVSCAIQKKLPNALMCPLSCIKTCLAPPSAIPSPPSQMFLTNEIDHNNYYCKLGCATRHCVSLSSVQNPNVKKVADCVDSCSDKCSTKN
ncbi:Thionin-like protein 2 [Cardamine amara subsp. amara]|uniref:Thionin-like protein 2 n=1 Tax=Cardamine amara subsp. amara TaxID=228776 RepID=A0ABD1BCR0_CARAN